MTSYIHSGGLAIIGLGILDWGARDVLDELFQKTFNLSWRCGDGHDGIAQISPDCVLPHGVDLSMLPQTRGIGALFLKDVQLSEKIVIPYMYGGLDDLDDLTKQDIDEMVSEMPAATAATKVGDGYLGFCGHYERLDGPYDPANIILAFYGIKLPSYDG